ncbi:MAG: hypothetical protein JWM47_3091, partial [Acidimicrobiales bacterium]|nr:hypothetical protein [Acidimicrobiales bacterium]
MSELETGFKIGEVTALIRRQFLVVGAAVVVGLILAYVLLAGAPTKYSATARVLVGPDPMQTAGNGSPLPPVMETEKQLVKTDDSVAAAVRKSLNLTVDNRTVRQHIVVTTTDKSTVMDISYTAAGADLARRGADAVAKAYLDNRKLTIAQNRDDQVAALTSSLNALKATANDKQAALDATKAGTAEHQAAQADLSQANAAVGLAQTKRDTAATINPTTSGTFIQHASTPAAV